MIRHILFWKLQEEYREGEKRREAEARLAASVETLTASPDDLRRCGLDAPALVIALDFEGADAVRRNLMLGARAPDGGRYATVGGADAVFVLDRATAAALMVSITE